MASASALSIINLIGRCRHGRSEALTVCGPLVAGLHGTVALLTFHDHVPGRTKQPSTTADTDTDEDNKENGPKPYTPEPCKQTKCVRQKKVTNTSKQIITDTKDPR